jgi:hypothetical protein
MIYPFASFLELLLNKSGRNNLMLNMRESGTPSTRHWVTASVLLTYDHYLTRNADTPMWTVRATLIHHAQRYIHLRLKEPVRARHAHHRVKTLVHPLSLLNAFRLFWLLKFRPDGSKIIWAQIFSTDYVQSITFNPYACFWIKKLSFTDCFTQISNSCVAQNSKKLLLIWR